MLFPTIKYPPFKALILETAAADKEKVYVLRLLFTIVRQEYKSPLPRSFHISLPAALFLEVIISA